jgi:uncharacterized cupin superfamily protein
VRRANLHSPDLASGFFEREGYRWQSMGVGRAIGASQIGATLYVLPDGERTYPFHVHHAIEEWLLVVAGTPTLRDDGDEERRLRPGDLVCFPTGPEGGHQVRGPGSVLIVSTKPPLEVSEYPDSGKVGVSPSRKLFRVGDAVDYWDGE